MHEQQLIKDFRAFSTHKPPVRRAAYSDRTAWLMAILSELAYARFDEEDENSILELAAELAELTDQEVIANKIASLVRQSADNCWTAATSFCDRFFPPVVLISRASCSTPRPTRKASSQPARPTMAKPWL